MGKLVIQKYKNGELISTEEKEIKNNKATLDAKEIGKPPSKKGGKSTTKTH